MNMRYILTSLLFFSFTNSLFSMQGEEKKTSYLEQQGYPATKPEVWDTVDFLERLRKQLSEPEVLDLKNKIIQNCSQYNRKNIFIGTGVTLALGAAGYWFYSKFYKIRTPLKKVETDQASQTTQDDIFDFIAENQEQEEQEPKVPNSVQHRFDNLGFEQLFDKFIATLSNDQWHMYDDMDDKLIRIHGNPLILKDKDFEHFLCVLNEEQKAIVELMIEKFTLEKK